jgi:3'-phosphoadenosine 5'-phosphosulfate sulfotransferase (PAPS reductase)/FAD synthetase
MDSLKERELRLHSDTDDYLRRVTKAEEWVEYVFSRFENPCLNYSGGKDSLVLLHLVAERCGYDDVDIYHFDNGLLNIPGTEDYVRDSVERVGGNLYRRTSEKAQSEDMVLEEGHGYAGFWGWYAQLQEEHEWDVRLLGIRAEESRRRRDRYGEPPVSSSEEYTSAAPVHQLRTEDVWAYIVENELEYHDVYDRQARLFDSIDHRDNRLVTLYDSEFDSLGAREVSQFIYPSETNELKAIEQDKD